MSFPTSQSVTAVKPVIGALEELETPYYIAGSLASSTDGVVRSTIDADLVADLVADLKSKDADEF